MLSVIDGLKNFTFGALGKQLNAQSKLVFMALLVLVTGISDASAVVFESTGALQMFTVPAGVTSIDVKMWGAGGGCGGGAGGYSSGILPVTPGETLNIVVGGKGNGPNGAIGGNGGFGGGGAGGNGVNNPWDSGGCGGGGRSEISGSGGIIIAGGGGGTGAGGVAGSTAAGGGDIGQTGSVSACYNTSGGSGYGGAGGVGGAGGTGCYNGVYGQGNGAPGTNTDGGKGGDDPGGMTLPWMGPRGRGGGGGGGGFGGGGGGGAGDYWTTGVGAGGGGRTIIGGITLTGNGSVPPNISDLDRGAAGNPDNDGRVVFLLEKFTDVNLVDATYGAGAGSFELGDFINNGNGFMPLAPGATTMLGWTVGGPGDGIDWLSAPSFGAHSGLHSVDLIHGSASSVTTVIPTVSGQIYELSFYAATPSTGNTLGSVSAGSLVDQSFIAPVTPGGDFINQEFAQHKFLFKATGNTTAVSFKSLRSGCFPDCYGPAIDNVSVVQASNFFGGTLKTSFGYQFTIEQSNQQTEAIQLINTGDAVHSATLEIVNPHTGLILAITEPNPVNVAAGETKSIPLNIGSGALPIGIYEGILLKITANDGSTLYSNIKINVVAQGAGNLPDLTLSASDIGFSVANPGDPVTLSATIHNQGNSASSNILVRFFEFGALLGETVVPEITANGTANASISVPMDPSGDHLVRVVIDPVGAIPEIDETNNEASQIIQPGGATVETSGNMLVSGSLPTTVYSNSLFSLSGKAVYDVLVNGARNTDYVVKGGSVQLTLTGDDGAEWTYGNIHTDANGNVVKSLQAPPNPGLYHIAMTVTDKTFIGKRELVFNVVEPPAPGSPEPTPPTPPMTSGLGHWTFVGGSSGGSWTWTWTTPPKEPVPQTDLRVFSENIHFSKNHPAKDEEVTIFAQINYWATNTDLLAENVPVNIYVTYPGNPSLKIGEALISQMSVGSPDFGSRYVYATWRNREEGIHLVEVEIDPSFIEENQLNNAATRAIIVGQLQAMRGAIAGQVTDAWGNGIGNVIIDVNEAGGTPFANTVTDQAGFYLVDNVPLGAMSVHIETPTGYQADAETKATEVADSTVSTVNFMLATQAAPADKTPPVLNLPANIIAEATGPTGGMVTYSATANDAVDGTIVPTCIPASGGMFALGATHVSCSATDQAGNTANGGFNVTVQDTMPPILVCPADVSVMQGQQPVLGTPTVSDSVDPAPLLSNNAPADYPTGTTAVVWTATDASGNHAGCVQQVTASPVAANLAPVADAGADQTVRQGSLVTLNGSGSDPDHGPSPLAFVWSQTGGAVNLVGGETAQPTFTPTSNGIYTFQLIVNDGAANSAPDDVQITVPLLCDIDQDGDVDRNDTSLITAARNQPALPGDLRDYDGDGIVTVNDARACVLKCTRARCAP